ncbi:unnamed protein product, partial [Staurois parvus]
MSCQSAPVPDCPVRVHRSQVGQYRNQVGQYRNQVGQCSS